MELLTIKKTGLYQYETKVRVRYGETDQMGYLYYGNYALYYEVGRVELFRSLGMTYKGLEEEHNIMMPVLSLQQRFIRPAFYDNLLTIRTSVRKMPEKAVTFHVEIFNEDQKLVNGGTVRLAFVDMKTGKTVAAPSIFTDKLKPWFED